jgi:hypothetical protein
MCEWENDDVIHWWLVEVTPAILSVLDAVLSFGYSRVEGKVLKASCKYIWLMSLVF